ncbi:restriction endonuclease subunit S [Brevibacterium zhoupengii]|uniref:restriction endonuclease subunit S n=1 Tax=Brevibacterium zhoupengii TaxID=2898795 RepID=UPI001F08BE54|nr:restriction endonuclease subunit S [Brevibacterium zhoupengii]
MRDEWREAALSDVLEQVRRPVDVGDLEEVRYAGVRWYAAGVYERDVVPASDVKATELNRIQSGDIVYNRMWVTKASFGIVDDAADGCLVTNDFPIFNAKPGVALAEYIALMFFWPPFLETASDSASGTTERRRLNEKVFLTLTVPLPPFDEQRRIVDLIGSVDAAIEAVERLLSETRHILGAMRACLPGEEVPLSDLLVEIKTGRSPRGVERIPTGDEKAVLKVSAIGNEGFVSTEVKVVDTEQALDKNTRVNANDVLMVRASGALDRVGVVCRVLDDHPQLYLSDKTLRLSPRFDRVKAAWLAAALKSPSARQ